jgi:crossover junction endodeoxyribonuclease RusA
MTDAAEWHIDLPLTAPMSLNDRQHWRTKAAATKSLRRAVMLLSRSKQIPRCERVSVELHWVPNTVRRRDGDNPAPTVKACVDGLRDAGVVDDDDQAHVVHQPTA